MAVAGRAAPPPRTWSECPPRGRSSPPRGSPSTPRRGAAAGGSPRTFPPARGGRAGEAARRSCPPVGGACPRCRGRAVGGGGGLTAPAPTSRAGGGMAVPLQVSPTLSPSPLCSYPCARALDRGSSGGAPAAGGLRPLPRAKRRRHALTPSLTTMNGITKCASGGARGWAGGGRGASAGGEEQDTHPSGRRGGGTAWQGGGTAWRGGGTSWRGAAPRGGARSLPRGKRFSLHVGFFGGGAAARATMAPWWLASITRATLETSSKKEPTALIPFLGQHLCHTSGSKEIYLNIYLSDPQGCRHQLRDAERNTTETDWCTTQLF